MHLSQLTVSLPRGALDDDGLKPEQHHHRAAASSLLLDTARGYVCDETLLEVATLRAHQLGDRGTQAAVRMTAAELAVVARYF